MNVDILIKSAYVPLLPLDMLKFKSLNRFTWKTHQIFEEVLWYGERYWQSQPFTVNHGMNSINDLHCKKRKGYRK